MSRTAFEKNESRKMSNLVDTSNYRYSAILPEFCNIRLLCLNPSKRPTSEIYCHLFDYSVDDSLVGTHMYEALSYTWGTQQNPLPIYIDNKPFHITENLYAALSHLRNHSLVRFLWIDALCINQEDPEEKAGQIVLMARIFAKASRVIVWLGEAKDNSDEALRAIHAAAATTKIAKSPTDEVVKSAILALLKREWYGRVWVLQEVAVARDLLVKCGAAEIIGFMFCSGLQSLEHLYSEDSALSALIRSVVYLMREATSRTTSLSLTETTLPGIIHLGALLDMFHTRKATIRHDKVYALLGMCSDANLIADKLVPDYSLPWTELFQQLMRVMFSQELNVTIGEDPNVALFKSKASVLGRVDSAKDESTRSDMQKLVIKWIKNPVDSVENSKGGTKWTTVTPVEPICAGDILCLLEGASTPTIIRPKHGYFHIISLATIDQSDDGSIVPSGFITDSLQPPKQVARGKSVGPCWQPDFHSITTFPYDIILSWDWEKSLNESNIQYISHLIAKTTSESFPSVPTHFIAKDESRNNLETEAKKLSAESRDHLKRAARLVNASLVLTHVRLVTLARHPLQEACGIYETIHGKNHPHTLASLDELATAYLNLKRYKEAEDITLHTMGTRRQTQGLAHPDIRNGAGFLLSIYHAQGFETNTLRRVIDPTLNVGKAANEESVCDFFRTCTPQTMIVFSVHRFDFKATEEAITAMAQNRKADQVLRVFLEWSEGDVPITDHILYNAAENGLPGVQFMTLLLKYHGGKFKITWQVLETAVVSSTGQFTLARLLDDWSDVVEITENLLEEAAKYCGSPYSLEIVEGLFNWSGNKIEITGNMVIAAASNRSAEGVRVMALLLSHSEREAMITENTVVAAASNSSQGHELMRFLLSYQSGHKVKITEKVLVAVALNEGCGCKTMDLLLSKPPFDVKVIAENIVVAAASNSSQGDELMRLLLSYRRGHKVKITEKVLVAVALNEECGYTAMDLLLSKRPSDVKITEKVLLAVALNEGCGCKTMDLLLSRRPFDVNITEAIICEAVQNRRWEMVQWLLSQPRLEIKVTNRVLEEAATTNGKDREFRSILEKVQKYGYMSVHQDMRSFLNPEPPRVEPSLMDAFEEWAASGNVSGLVGDRASYY